MTTQMIKMVGDKEYFFRPTPSCFRQVVQHVGEHVAIRINRLISSRKGHCCSGRKSKLVEDRYIVLCTVTLIKKNPAKQQETNKQTKPETNNQKQHTPMSGDVTSTSLWVKRSIKAEGDNSVSSRNMHNDNLSAMLTQAHRNKQPTPKSQWATSTGVGSNKAQCGNQGSLQPGSPRSQRAAFTA